MKTNLEFKNVQLVIPSYTVWIVFLLGVLGVNFGIFYFLVLFLGIDSYAEKNTFNGVSMGFPLRWPLWLRKSLRGLGWALIVFFAVGSIIKPYLK